MNGMLELVTRDNLIPFGYAMALVLLLSLTAALVLQFMLEIRHDAPRLESHWGGFGGGLGGWEVSRSLVYLTAALGFALLTVNVLQQANEDFIKSKNVSSATPSVPAKPVNASSSEPTAASSPADGVGSAVRTP